MIASSYAVILDSIIVAVVVASVANAIAVKIFLATVGGVRAVILGEREGEREREREREINNH